MQPTVIYGQRVVLAGRLDVASAARVRAALHAAVLDGTGDLVVDMAGVDTLDAVGLGVLMGTHRLATASGRALVLTGCTPRIARLLRAIRLDRVLRLADQPAAA